MGKLLIEGSTKLFSGAKDNNEYKKMMRTLTGDNKSTELSHNMLLSDLEKDHDGKANVRKRPINPI